MSWKEPRPRWVTIRIIVNLYKRLISLVDVTAVRRTHEGDYPLFHSCESDRLTDGRERICFHENSAAPGVFRIFLYSIKNELKPYFEVN